MRYLTEYTDTELQEHRNKVQQFISKQLPMLKTELPSIRMLTVYFIGRNLVAPLKSAEEFVAIRPAVSTYRQLLPKLEHYLNVASNMQSTIKKLEKDGTITKKRKHTAVATVTEATTVPEASPSVTTVSHYGSEGNSLRPQHFDQYAHMLPESFTVFYKETLPQLYSNRADHHTHLRDLALRTPDSSSAERAKLARVIRNLDRYISLFWKRVDAYYEIAIGKQVPEHILKEMGVEFRLIGKTIHLEKEKPSLATPKMTLSELQVLPDSEDKQQAIQSRIERNKKFLRRTDRKKSAEILANIQLAAQELHSVGILITDKQAEVCAYYGYIVPIEWQEPSLEERKAQQAKAKSDKAKAQRAEAREAKRKAKEQALLDNPPLD